MLVWVNLSWLGKHLFVSDCVEHVADVALSISINFTSTQPSLKSLNVSKALYCVPGFLLEFWDFGSILFTSLLPCSPNLWAINSALLIKFLARCLKSTYEACSLF